MKEFAELITRLDQSNKTSDKLGAIGEFFSGADDSYKVRVIAIFTHHRPKWQVSTRQLREWCQVKAGIPAWLFDEGNGSVCKKEYPGKIRAFTYY